VAFEINIAVIEPLNARAIPLSLSKMYAGTTGATRRRRIHDASRQAWDWKGG